MDDFEMTTEEEVDDTTMGRPHVVILGAGASLATCPQGDANGKKLPLMYNFVEVVGLEDVLEDGNVPFKGRNFEDIYADLDGDPNRAKHRQAVEDLVRSYFETLQLPDSPTLYDYLVLSLREKDIIATFNWDPFLYSACWRNHKQAKLPSVVYLHGSVAVGYCLKDGRKGKLGSACSQCGQAFTQSRLLFPVTKKDYAADPYIKGEWDTLRTYLKSAYILTVFGYSAPKSDVEAVNLLKEGWGQVGDKNLEEIEIIDIKSEEELRSAWTDFIHTHHYRTCDNFLESWISQHPRRTCEAMWNQLMECKFLDSNHPPRNCNLQSLWNWYARLTAAEKS